MDSVGFTEYLTAEGLAPRTIEYYVRDVQRANRWLATKGAHLANASATALAQYATINLPYTHSSRGRAVAAIRHYWLFIDRPRPPAKAIRVPPSPEYDCRALEEWEARALVKTSLGWWPEGGAVLLGLYLALRRFEIAKAEWSRFDPTMRWYNVLGKRDKQKTLPVHEVLRAELEPHRGSGFLFPARLHDGPTHPMTVWTWVLRVAEVAEVDNVTPHRLRHTSLATALDATRDLRGVQDFARHSRPSTTAIYTRTRSRRLREISDSLDYL